MLLSKTEPFSVDRTCKVCEETVHWTKFYKEGGMCKACWRIELSKEHDLVPNSKGWKVRERSSETNRAALQALLNKHCGV